MASVSLELEDVTGEGLIIVMKPSAAELLKAAETRSLTPAEALMLVAFDAMAPHMRRVAPGGA